MPGELFTAADIRRLAHEQNSSVLLLAPRDLITPEAADLARQLGIQVVRETSGAPPALPVTPRAAVAPAFAPLPPLKVARRGEAALEPFGKGALGVNVALRDVVTQADGSSMAAGYMALDATQPDGGVFAWTLRYDEVDIILEGELVITRNGEEVRGRAGDIIFIPKGSSITFGTPAYARFVYVAYPANWSELS
jgi:ethanolamine utilization protein EutQ